MDYIMISFGHIADTTCYFQIIVFCLVFFRELYSAGLNGQIIVWDVKSKTTVKEFSCSAKKTLRQIVLHDNKLWCCTLKLMYLLSLCFSVIHTISEIHVVLKMVH